MQPQLVTLSISFSDQPPYLVFLSHDRQHLYRNLRRSRDGPPLFVRVKVCVSVSDPRFIQFALCSYYAVHINALSI